VLLPEAVSRSLANLRQVISIASSVWSVFRPMHQVDVPLLDQIQELQAAVGVFLGPG